MSCKFYDSTLHTKAKPEEWQLMFPCILNCTYLSFNSPVAKTARHQYPLAARKYLFQVRIIGFDLFRIHPVDTYICIIFYASMM